MPTALILMPYLKAGDVWRRDGIKRTDRQSSYLRVLAFECFVRSLLIFGSYDKRHEQH